MAWISGKRGGFRVMWRTGGAGSSVKASRTFSNRADAEEERRAIEKDHTERKADAGTPTSSSPIPTLLKRWAASRQAEGWVREDHAKEVVAIVTALCESREWERLSDITAEAIDAWRVAKGGTGTDRPLQYLSGFLRWCRRVIRVRVDPSALEIAPRKRIPREQPSLLTREQVAHILQVSMTHGAQVVAAVEHLSLYACRPIDVCRATVGDYDAAALTISYRNTKNKRKITHPLHEAHARRLDDLVKDRPADAPLFLDAYNRGAWAITRGRASQLVSWYQANVGRVLRKRGVIAASQEGIYCLKDYAASMLMVATAGNIRQAMAISGHRTDSAFKRYLASNEQTQKATIAAVPLIELPALIPEPSCTLPS